MKATQVCSVDGCDRTGTIVRGVCKMHYERLRLQGLPPRPSVAERLAAGLVRMPNGCLEWTGNIVKGYGQIRVNGKPVYTHRLAWSLANGPIPEGMEVCHYCDNPPCCDVETCLFLGTHADNMIDMVAKGRGYQSSKTHCKNGHEFTEANTYVNAPGHRACRTCRRDADVRYKTDRTI